MEFPKFKVRQDLEKFIADGASEGTTLEFKDSRALTRDELKLVELCINVSALANSAGGQIIYGVNENKKTAGPIEIDQGVTDRSITRDWIGQILNSRIQPRLSTYFIDEVDLHNGQLGFVISVPQSLTGPHQAPDKKYYKRFALEVRAMEDYEIRDVMARATSPLLVPQLTFDGRVVTNYGFTSNPDASEPIPVSVLLRNASTAPAEYTGFSIGFARSLLITAYPPLVSIGQFDDGKGNTLQWYSRRVGIPADFPIFKELPLEIVPRNTAIKVPEHARWEKEFLVCARIQAPGFSAEHYWTIKNASQRLQIVEQV
jgi:hypothetical protein